jgi:Ca2+-binding EF-hand superfamily protein
MIALRLLSICLVALVLAQSASDGDSRDPKLPEDVFAHSPGEDVVDVLIFGSGRSAVVRVHVKAGTKSFRAVWDDFALRLHAYLDRNDDHVLTSVEASRVPWTNLLTSPVNRIQANQPGTSLKWLIDTNPTDGKISFDELVNYLQRTQNFDLIGTQTGPPPDSRMQAVFSQLDHDGDKIITADELAATDSLLARLDRDEDETLSLDELAPDRSPLADRFQGAIQGNTSFDSLKCPAIPLTSPEFLADAAKRLLGASPGGSKSAKIGPEQLQAAPTDFLAADRDRDGILDFDELIRYLESPTIHQELSISFPLNGVGQGRLEKVSKRAGGLPTRNGTNGAILVDVAGSEIEFLAVDFRNNLATVFDNQFKNADVDKNGVIDTKEAGANRFLQSIHPVADRNDDGKMTEAELKAYLAINSGAEDARVMLTISDQGIALQERLDADHDGRLSVRELRQAPARMAVLDTDHDGRFSLAELPRRTQINFGHGPFVNRNRLIAASFATTSNPRVNSDQAALPSWFVSMDRNQDGDVSAREFLGTSDQFRQFDSDGDGLIDGKEAVKIP